MKLKKLIITIMAVVLSLCLIIGGVYFINQDRIVFKPKSISVANQNNYTIKNNTVDYFNGRFAYITNDFISNSLIVVDSNGICKTVSGVSDSIKLLESRVLYVKNRKLFVEDIYSSNQTVIADEVYDFIADENKVFYSKLNNKNDLLLYSYDFENKATVCIAKNLDSFLLHNNKILVVNDKGELYSVEYDGSNEFELTTFDPPDFSVYQPYAVCSNKLICGYDDLYIYSLDTNKSETLCLNDGDCKGNHITRFVCNNDTIFLTYKRVEYDGSIVKNKQHKNNGVWKVDATTLSKKKVCNKQFDWLYLFDEDVLIGQNQKGIYQIDIETGKTTEMIKFGII